MDISKLMRRNSKRFRNKHDDLDFLRNRNNLSTKMFSSIEDSVSAEDTQRLKRIDSIRK